jgi:DNA-binding transcriptional ArsR family regulator
VFESSAGAASKLPFLLRMAKLFADPLRIRIVSELTMRPMSPKEFYEEFGGGSLSRVSRHFKVLFEYDWIELVEEKSGGARRGAIEHFYRATEPAVFDEANWGDLPETIKERVTWQVFATYVEQFKEALEAGTIDARPERHLTWSPALYDELGLKRILAKTMELYEFIGEEQTASNERMAESGEEPIPLIVALSVFETPSRTNQPKSL